MLDKELFDLFLGNPFDWDKDFYSFNRDEKDMHPYSIVENAKGGYVITHNILGINKEDLTLSKETEKGVTYLLINGKTKDSVTGKTYSINSRIALDGDALDLNTISAKTQNGLLYITINKKIELPKTKETKRIAID